MRRSIAIASGAILVLAASTASADSWIALGAERGQQVGVDLERVPANKAAPFTVPLASFTPGWAANGHAYTLRLAEFNCQARTRRVKTLIMYSSRRDPVTRPVEEGPVSDANPAVAMQLDALCNAMAAQRRRTFISIGAFAEALRR